VLLVVLYHSGFEALKSGFLGVDIFFVISGFLITGLIVRAIDNGTFTLGTFYFRRAKRLLPAAYVTIAATALLAPFLLAASQVAQLKQQILGAVTFSANFVLWRQSGYFDNEATTKPLLHFWSLAVEEQYYLVAPCILLLLPVRRRLAVVSAITAISLIYCFTLADFHPTAKFYFPFARAWELGFGSIGALLPLTWRLPARPWLFWPALAALAAVPFIDPVGLAPDATTLAVAVATLIVLLRRTPDTALAAPLAVIGNFSYSLYLVHWPVIVFMRAAFDQKPTTTGLAVAFALSIALGYILYRSVERPIHRARISLSLKAVAVTVACSIAILALPKALDFVTPPSIDFATIRRLNYGLDGSCDQKGAFNELPACRTSEHPKLLVWGDSHAMHLLPALKNYDGGVVQATRSACGPFLDIAPFLRVDTVYTRSAALACIDFNESVMHYLESAPSIEVVALASALSLYRSRGVLLKRTGETYEDPPTTPADVAAAARVTIARIRALGKRVVLVESPPFGGIDVGSCLEQRMRRSWWFRPTPSCSFSAEQFNSASAPELALTELIAKSADVPTVGFSNFLCGSGTCQTSPEGVFLYIDSAHLTVTGSEYLGAKLDLAGMIRSVAR
jgi:peptidoglycan/LPS O-acetylase OafA/YrhL